MVVLVLCRVLAIVMLDICDMKINILGNKFVIFKKKNFGSCHFFPRGFDIVLGMLDFHLNKLMNDTIRLERYVKIANSIVVNYLQRYEV